MEPIPIPPPPVLEPRGTYMERRKRWSACNRLITLALIWWRRGESEYPGVLKTRKLLISRPTKNAVYAKTALNWNVSGTRPRKRGAVQPRSGDNLSIKDAAANRALFSGASPCHIPQHRTPSLECDNLHSVVLCRTGGDRGLIRSGGRDDAVQPAHR